MLHTQWRLYLTSDKNRIPGLLMLWKQLIPSVHCADTLHSYGHTKLVIHPSITDFEANRFLVLGPYPHNLLFPYLPEASYLTPKCPYILHTSLCTPYLPIYPNVHIHCQYSPTHLIYILTSFTIWSHTRWMGLFSVLCFPLEKIVLEVVLQICYVEVLLMLVYYRKTLKVGVVSRLM